MAAAEQRRRQRGRRTDPLRRRDPPLQQGPAGRLPAARRSRRHRAHRRHDGEPVVRGERGAAVARRRCSSCSRSTTPTSSRILRRALADPERGLGALHAGGRRRGADGARRATPTAMRAVALNLLRAGRRGRAATPAGRPTARSAALAGRSTLQTRAALRQGRRGALQPHLGAAQVDAQQRRRTPRVYWLARMLEAGEDPLYVARRLVRFASEDVGNADPQALVDRHGREGRRALPRHARGATPRSPRPCVYLATAPKSNAVYVAYGARRATTRRATSPHRCRCTCATPRRG